MKVVLKVTVLDRIMEEFNKAARANREVDYVAVTPAEYDELRSDGRVHGYLHSDLYWRTAATAMEVVKYETRDFALLDTYRGYRGCNPYIRCASHEKVMGKPLFVVPAEYCPR